MSWNSCDVEKHVYLSRAQVARSDEHQSIGDEDMGKGKGRNDNDDAEEGAEEK